MQKKSYLHIAFASMLWSCIAPAGAKLLVGQREQAGTIGKSPDRKGHLRVFDGGEATAKALGTGKMKMEVRDVKTKSLVKEDRNPSETPVCRWDAEKGVAYNVVLINVEDREISYRLNTEGTRRN